MHEKHDRSFDQIHRRPDALVLECLIEERESSFDISSPPYRPLLDRSILPAVFPRTPAPLRFRNQSSRLPT